MDVWMDGWMLESPRVLEEVGRGRGEGSEPGSRLI